MGRCPKLNMEPERDPEDIFSPLEGKGTPLQVPAFVCYLMGRCFPTSAGSVDALFHGEAGSYMSVSVFCRSAKRGYPMQATTGSGGRHRPLTLQVRSNSEIWSLKLALQDLTAFGP